jgi:hypothetical protein
MLLAQVWNMLREGGACARYLTLSPKTEMATKFHTQNGASLLSNKEETDNFEYLVRRTPPWGALACFGLVCT